MNLTTIKKTKYNTIVKILIFFLIYRSIAQTNQGIFTVSYWDKYIFGIIICIILLVLLIISHKGKFPWNYKLLNLFKWLILPNCVAFIYAMLLNFIDPVPYSGFVTRSFSNVAFLLLALIQAYLMFLYFGKDGIEIAFLAYIGSFFTSFIVTILNGGIGSIIRLIVDSTYNASALEMSEVTPTLGIFMFYYLYELKFHFENRKKMLLKIFICAFCLFIGMKRIMIVATLISYLIYLVLNKKVKNHKSLKKWYTVGTLLIIFLCYLYVGLIKSGIFYDIINYLGINTMARTDFWKGIERYYDFSPFYFGHGIGYTSKWMDNNWSGLNILGLSQTTGLHNDILKFYIDLGFVGFFVYFWLILRTITLKIEKNAGVYVGFLYFLLMCLQIVGWTTDNYSLYHVFLWPFYMIIFVTFKRFMTNGNSKI